MARKWMQKVAKTMKTGAFRSQAKRAGGLDKNGKIKASFIDSAKRSPNPVTRKRAVLAATFKKAKK